MERNRYLAAALLMIFLLLPFSGCGREPGRLLDLTETETEKKALDRCRRLGIVPEERMTLIAPRG